MPSSLPPAANPPSPGPGTERAVAALLDRADTLRQAALDAGLAHAEIRHQLAATLLRTQWPTAAAVDADLARHLALEGNPDIYAVLDPDGHHLWSRTAGEPRDEVIDEVETVLSIALDFADHIKAGWVRMRPLGLDVHRLALPDTATGGGSPNSDNDGTQRGGSQQ